MAWSVSMLTQPDLAMRLSDEVCTYEYTYVVKLTSVQLAYEGSHLQTSGVKMYLLLYLSLHSFAITVIQL